MIVQTRIRCSMSQARLTLVLMAVFVVNEMAASALVNLSSNVGDGVGNAIGITAGIAETSSRPNLPPPPPPSTVIT